MCVRCPTVILCNPPFLPPRFRHFLRTGLFSTIKEAYLHYLCKCSLYMGYDTMEWNSRTPTEWDWEAVSLCSGKATGIPQQLQSLNHEMGVDGGVHNGSIYSFGNGGFSGSDLTHGSSFKCSISASADTSSKESTETFTSVALPKDSIEKKNSAGVDNTESFTKLGASIGSGEPLIGLKLGKRTYFEDACPSTMCKASSLPIVSAPANTTKRSRAMYQNTEAPQCQVEGCNLNLNSAKEYHRRHRICETHSKSPKVIVAGMARRFCQQCSRFHDLSAFDDKKRSCRRRLSDHNARRRRPQLEKVDFNSASLSSSAYDARHQINFVSDGVPIPVANSVWQKVMPSGASLIKPTKVGVTDRHLDFADNDILNAVSMLHLDTAKVLSFDRGTPVRNKGMEASTIGSTLNGTPEFPRALSLLSTNPCGSNHPQSSNLGQFMHVESQNWAGSSDYVRSELLPSEHRFHSFNFRNSSSNSISFQEFPSFRAYDSGCMYSNQIN